MPVELEKVTGCALTPSISAVAPPATVTAGAAGVIGAVVGAVPSVTPANHTIESKLLPAVAFRANSTSMLPSAKESLPCKNRWFKAVLSMTVNPQMLAGSLHACARTPATADISKFPNEKYCC